MTLKAPALPDIRGGLTARFPFSAPPPPTRTYEVGSVALGRAHGQPVALPRRPRFEHTHVIGTTGGGKTNLLEHLIRQDIKNGDGVFVIDPHGSHPNSLFRSLITWLFANGFHKSRTIHLIDPNCADFTTGFNPLELPDECTSPSVVAGTALEAFERVWGDEDTHSKPTIRRILKATFAALAELRMTLAEADFLFDHHDALGVRELLIHKLNDRYALKVFSDLDQLAKADRTGLRFRDEVVGPLNRLAEFTSAPAIRRIVGQRHNTINLREALDGGHVILVNLSGGDAVNDADCELLGRLLTRFLFFHVKRRTTSRPFWFYLDECQRYLSGDIPSLLAEARKFATGIFCSHQWQAQLSNPDDQVLAAVHNATNLKIAFRVKHPKEAQEIAESIIPLDLEMPVRALVKPTVVGHHRTYFDNWSVGKSESWGTSVSESTSETITDSEGESTSETESEDIGWSASNTTAQSQTQSYDGWGQLQVIPNQTAIGISGSAGAGKNGSSATASSTSHSSGRSVSATRGTTTTESYSRGRSESHGASEGLEPIYEKLPSAVHSYQNALYFAAQRLRSLAAGEAFASFVDSAGMHTAHVHVPHVKPVSVSEATFIAIRKLIFSRSPSAIETPNAITQLEHHEAQLLIEAKQVPQLEPEPNNFRVPSKKRADL
jgi:hypothetical protein